MYPKSPKQEESSKMCVFVGNSIAICCAMCSGKRVPLGGGIGQKEGGLEVRQKTVETTEHHRPACVSSPLGTYFSLGTVQNYSEGLRVLAFCMGDLLQKRILLFLGLVKTSQG